MLLQDRVAVVTGAGSGIGEGIAVTFARHGASLLLADNDGAAIEAVAARLRERGAAVAAVSTDVSERRSTDSMAAAALDVYGRIDVLVNNAGVAGAAGWHGRDEPSLQDWESCWRVNLQGAVNAAGSVVHEMKRARRGSIVNVSSISGREGRPVFPHYAASKAALLGYTQSLAVRLAGFGINVNAVCPGIVWTPMWDQVGARFSAAGGAYAGLAPREVYERMVAERVPTRRGQTAEDIAEAVAFFASDEAAPITGQALNVDGGIYLR